MSSFTSKPVTLIISHLVVVAITALAVTQFTQTPATPTAVTNSTLTPALFRVAEREYRFYDLPIEYRQPLHEIRKFAFQQEMLLIEDALVEAYIQQQMQTQNLGRTRVQAALMPGAEPSEEEVVQFYNNNQSASAPPLENMRADLVQYLTAAKQEQLKKTLLTRLLVNGDAQMLVEAPSLNRPATPVAQD